MSANAFISTTIPYVNARPHLGHALEYLQADAYARHMRAQGRDVWFLSGSDENSLRNVLAAEQEGLSPQALVDRNVGYFEQLITALDVDVSGFIRTSTDPDHRAGATEIWRRMAARGDIYARDYEGLYCVGCEQFYTPAELTDGKCPEHFTAPEPVGERNYFFRLSRYADELLEALESRQLQVVPETRRNETLGFIRQGLADISISRSTERARGWGIPVPDDPGQVMYVWIDALTNYVNALGWTRAAAAVRAGCGDPGARGGRRARRRHPRRTGGPDRPRRGQGAAVVPASGELARTSWRSGAPTCGGSAWSANLRRVNLRSFPRRPNWRSLVLWPAVFVCAVWAAVRVFGLDDARIMQLMAFTPYVLPPALVVTVVAVLLRRWWPAAVAALAALTLLTVLVPRATRDGQGELAGPRLRVLTANLLFGGADLTTIMGEVRRLNVDVLALQEFTEDAQRRLQAAGVADVLPHHAAFPDSGASGSAVYSRYPMADRGMRRNPGGWHFAQAHGTVLVPGARPVLVESVHPTAPTDHLGAVSWATDIRDQPAATPDGLLRVLAGDFNSTLDHAGLRRLIDTGYRDAADTVGDGLGATWPYDERWYIPGVTLDRVLADRRIGVAAVHQLRTPDSDHKAVYAELVLPRA
jgi:endonuclease/exonuclease/phosphatase (EEP) superfamily protein YafD